MNLHQEISLIESQGPVPAKLTLDEIITAGKVTNPYQIFVLSWLCEFFKNGVKPGMMVVGDPVAFGDATSTEHINALKALSGDKQVALAEFLKMCIDIGQSDVPHCPLSPLEWLQNAQKIQK